MAGGERRAAASRQRATDPVGQQRAAGGAGRQQDTGSATIPGDITAGRVSSKTSGSHGQARYIPNTEFGESAVGFYRNGNSSVDVAGDFWAVGHNAYGPGDRHFGIGCYLSNLCLSISPAGVVNIPYSLTIKGVAAQTIPHVSCRVFGTTVLNSVGQVTPSVTSGASGYRTVTFSDHPAGVNFTPMATLTDVGRIVVTPPTVANSVQVITYNTADTATNVTFYLLIL